MNIIDMFMQQQQQPQQQAPQQTEVPSALLAILTQGQSNMSDMSSLAASMFQNQAPQIQPINMPEMRPMGRGLGDQLVSSFLDDYLDERKQKKLAAAQAAEQELANQEIQAIRDSGKSGPDLYYSMMQAHSPLVQKLGTEGIQSLFAPKKPENIKIFEGGVTGDPSMRQNYTLGPDNSVIPLGPAYKPGSGVTINTGDMNEVIKPSDALHVLDASGNAAVVPVGMTTKEAREKGYRYGTQPSDAATQKEGSSALTSSMIKDMKTARAKGASISGVGGKIQDIRSGTDIVGVGANALLDVAGKTQNPENVKLYSTSKALGNTLLQLMRGAAVGPQEQEMFEKQLPVAGQPDELFDANLDLTEKNIELLKSRIAETSGRNKGGQEGKSEKPRTPPPPPQIGEVRQGYQFIGGDPGLKSNWRPM